MYKKKHLVNDVDDINLQRSNKYINGREVNDCLCQVMKHRKNLAKNLIQIQIQFQLNMHIHNSRIALKQIIINLYNFFRSY